MGDEVEFHYVCFVSGCLGGDGKRRLFMLDGDRVGGPVDTGVVMEDGADVLEGAPLEYVRSWIARAEGRTEVGLMALVDRSADFE